MLTGALGLPATILPDIAEPVEVTGRVMARAAVAVPPGSDGIIALDIWQGCRTPFRDPRRRGAFTGLVLGHGRAHLYRALLESVAYGGRQVTETFDEAGAGLVELVLTGSSGSPPGWGAPPSGSGRLGEVARPRRGTLDGARSRGPGWESAWISNCAAAAP